MITMKDYLREKFVITAKIALLNSFEQVYDKNKFDDSFLGFLLSVYDEIDWEELVNKNDDLFDKMALTLNKLRQETIK